MKILEGLYYSKDHEWVRVEGNKAYIGITDFAQHQLGDIVYVELPDTDTDLAAGEPFGVIESVKAASDSFSPVSGRVIEINEEVTDDPTLLNREPYETWLLAVEISDKSELDELMSPEDYESYTSKEE